MEEKKEHHEEKKEEHYHIKKNKKTNIWPYISLALVILLGISIYFNLSSGGITGLSTADASDKILNFVNTNLMQPGLSAELKSIEEVNGIYRLELDVDGQEFESYVTKDGEIFFPQGFIIKELEEELAMLEEEGEVSEVTTPTEMVKSDKPNVKMFVMTYCPFGQQAENGLGPALEVLGDSVDFEPHFVIYSNYASNRGADWGSYCFDEEEKYCSMHGINELNEGVRQLCIFDSTPEKWWDYVNKINADCSLNEIETCWKGVAEEVGISVSGVETCFEEKGELLLKKELLLNQKYGVRGSPAIIINEADYNGGRSPDNFKEGICNAFNTPPEECGETLSTSGAASSGSC